MIRPSNDSIAPINEAVIMIEHMTFKVSDVAKSKDFYAKALHPLGYEPGYDEVCEGARVVGFTRNGKFDTWFTSAKPVSGPTHITWLADNRDQVHAFFEAALAAGGKSNGKPALRPHYHKDYYGAFITDPDGNHIEAVCHRP